MPTGVTPLIKDIKFGALLAGKAFDVDWIIDEMHARRATICISQRPQRKAPPEIDEERRNSRRLVANFFCGMKDFKRIATRSDKTDTVFSAMIHTTSALIKGR